MSLSRMAWCVTGWRCWRRVAALTCLGPLVLALACASFDWGHRNGSKHADNRLERQRTEFGGHREVIPIPNYPNALSIGVRAEGRPSSIHLCQALGQGSSCPTVGVDCGGGPCCDSDWNSRGPIPWEVFAQGEYVGPARLAHLPEYRIRVDDRIELIFRLTGKVSPGAYRINVGDVLRVESLTDKILDREIIVQPDGTVALRLLGQVRAEGLSVDDLRKGLDERYKEYVEQPNITVTPLKVNTTLEELRATVDNRGGAGGQSQEVTHSQI